MPAADLTPSLPLPGPGLDLEVELDPTSFHLASDAGGPAFGAGTHRMKFTYRLEPGMGGQDPLPAYSAEFPIG